MIHELEKDKMDAMRAIADANMKVSEAKAALSSLKGEESKYLAEREKAALEAVHRALKDSEELLKGAYANHEQVRELQKSVSELAAWVIEAHGDLKGLVADFKERDDAWKNAAAAAEAEISDRRRQLDADAVRIKNDRESIARERDQMGRERARLADERETLRRAINRIKEGRI